MDSDTGLDLGREVRSYFIPDFSAWKDEVAFEASAARLLNDLRAQAKGAGTAGSHVKVTVPSYSSEGL